MDNQDNQFFQLHYYTGLSLLTDVPYISPIKHNSTHAWVKHKDQCCVLRVSWFISMLAPKYSIKYTLFIFMMYKMYWKYAIHGMEVPPFFFFKMWVLKYQPHLPVVVYTESCLILCNPVDCSMTGSLSCSISQSLLKFFLREALRLEASGCLPFGPHYPGTTETC